MIVLFSRLIFVMFIVLFLAFRFFKKRSRVRVLYNNFCELLFKSNGFFKRFWVLYLLFIFLLVSNVVGNLPLSNIPTLFYSETFTLSLLFWIPIMLCVSLRQVKSFIAHLLPYGAPAGLMLFLPLVEIFSQIIRPLTLMIRLRTNLSRGHIIMYMFSYFALLSNALIKYISIFLVLLFILEIFISALQAYIFVTLVSLYVAETV